LARCGSHVGGRGPGTRCNRGRFSENLHARGVDAKHVSVSVERDGATWSEEHASGKSLFEQEERRRRAMKYALVLFVVAFITVVCGIGLSLSSS